MIRYLLVAFFALTSPALAQMGDWEPLATIGAEVVVGCEGEGCGCPSGNIAQEQFTLRKGMGDRFPVLATFPKGTRVGVVQAFSVRLQSGQLAVTKAPRDAEGKMPPVKPGDVVHNVFYAGEGLIQGRVGARPVVFDGTSVESREVSKPRYDVWYLISVGNRIGFSKTFPFEGCLG